jgi:hypothetical protein
LAHDLLEDGMTLPSRSEIARCPHCTGNMTLDAEEGVPGLFDFKCMACGKTQGEVLGADLEAKCGFTRQQVRYLTARGSLPVWIMDESLLHSIVRTMKLGRAGVHE